MRNKFISAALVALAFATTAAAQTTTSSSAPSTNASPAKSVLNNSHVVLNTLVGPSFVGQDATFNSRVDAGVKISPWLSAVGEWGTMLKAPAESSRLAGQHFNGNLIASAHNVWNLRPYATFGVGEFRNSNSKLGATDVNKLAFNYGGGAMYDVNKWLGFGLDFRRFEVNMDPHKGDSRFTAGFTIGLR